MATTTVDTITIDGHNHHRPHQQQQQCGPNYHIRYMTETDVPEVLQIWGDNNLHEGTHTIQSFLKVDPEGFVVAVDDRTGQVLGMCAGVFINPDTGFIGLYGVDPVYQKLGIGLNMWQKIMAHIGDRNAGLYAVPEHLVMYRDRAGFAREDSRQMVLYDGESVRLRDLVKSMDGIRVEPIVGDQLVERVVDYDNRGVHRYSRSRLLPGVFREPDSVALVAVDEYDDQVVGYGCMRTNNIGKAMAGPVYANNDALAELLVYSLIDRFPTAQTRGLLFMTLDSNPGGIRIADKLGLGKQEQLPRFFNKFVYTDAQWDRVYCIHSPNFAIF
ncbi:uncharacterized protein LOC128962023 [Oppia nitens]|uniref:uncharacterized protein LOC128962023 n=1 Tax=Oppia nitens TaxID=1686743 RepID=UPI0023DC4650|nr:uncharacterized protein LOC128962023 [Oppia nitens]